MLKYLISILALLVLAGCGEKSEIDESTTTQVQTMAQQYGDGELTYFPIIVPLTENALDPFESPLMNINNQFLFVGGFAKILMDTAAKLGMGKTHLTLEQPIYQFPAEYIKDARIKRVFFYIQPEVENEARGLRGIIRKFPIINRWGAENFNFLDKLAIKVSSHEMKVTESWLPIFDVKNLERKEARYLSSLFVNQQPFQSDVVDVKEVRELILLRYQGGRQRSKYIRSDTGKIFIINTERPAQTRHFFEDHPKLKGYFRRIHLLKDSVLVELVDDPVVEEGFNIILSEERETLDRLGLGVYDLHACTQETCLDLKVQNLNLVPLLTRGNAIKLDAYINANKVPTSFKLKGFIEFEVKVKLSF